MSLEDGVDDREVDPADRQGRVRVLVIAGDGDRGESVRSSLAEPDESISVAVETDGERAVERLDTGRIDCVVCGSRSTARNGFSLLAAVRDRYPRLPFVLLNDGGRVCPAAAVEAGATDCVRTPITDDRAPLVARRIRNYGERYRTERRVQACTESARQTTTASGRSDPDPDSESDGRHECDVVHDGERGDDRESEREPGPEPEDRTQQSVDRTSRAKLQALSAAFPDVGLILDENGRYLDVYAGPDAESLLIDDPDALVGRSVFETLPAEQASLHMGGIANALETGEVQTIEYKLEVPAGDRWFEGRIAPFEDRLDGIHAVGMVVRDVTKHKETELKLRRQEAHLTQAQAVADLGSWTVDLRENDIEWSDEVYRIFDCDLDEPISPDQFLDYVHPEDRELVEREWEAALHGVPFDVEHRIVVEGETKWVRETAEITFDDGAPIHAIGIIQDITDRKRYEQRLEFQNEQLEVFNRIIRHDLRNQLNIVDGYASLLEDRFDEGTVIADQICEATDELLAISEEIREVNRLLSDGSDRRPTRLAALLEDVLASVRDAYSDRSFECETSVPESLWVFERAGLEIALENVIENAIEHNDAPRPRVAITAEERSDRDVLEVRIADNGPGIPASEREILTGNRERSQLEHTSGLGLWTVHWILSTVGGELAFETNRSGESEAEDGRRRGAGDCNGTVVTIRLPCAERPEQSVRA